MEIKKSPKADLEGTKTTGLLIGYVIVLAFIFAAFELNERDIKIDTSQAITDLYIEEEMIPITEQQEEVKPETPPPPAPPAVAEVLEIVSDTEDVEEAVVAVSEDTGQKVDISYTPPVEEKEEEAEETVIFDIVEKMPEFPGGTAALMKYLSDHIKYPTISQENGVQGRVIVQFVVNRDGSIVDAKVARGVDPYLDKEALRVVSSMPKWNPGMQRSKAVRVKYTLPVMFRLN